MAIPKGKVQPPVLSTAGAVSVRNENGDMAMEKVKVSRYVSGKRPEYAPESSDEDDDADFGGLGHMKKSTAAAPGGEKMSAELDDRRLKRLQRQLEKEDDVEERVARHRRLHEPEVLAAGSDGEGEDEDDMEEELAEKDHGERRREEMEESSEEEEEELDEEEIERRRALLRSKVVQQREEEEVMELEEEKREGSEGDSSEWEEYTDSEEEDAGPRLKPVFVRKKDRVTIQEKEREVLHQRELEQTARRQADDRRRETLKYIESEVRKELNEGRVAAIAAPLAAGDGDIADVDTGDENDEQEYEAWKVRELKRIKRDRDDKEMIEKEHQEVDRLHNMTEEERRQELKQNPKRIVNKASKGKYKFLQKFYHRGAFFLDQEDGVYTRDFSCPTLEDHFDKTILPKVMQVKNFGRSGRTKYTHLVDQDTTSFDSPWASDTTMNLKFHSGKGGGMKQVFDRPTGTKRK